MQRSTKKRMRGEKMGASLSALVVMIPMVFVLAVVVWLLRLSAGAGILINGFLLLQVILIGAAAVMLAVVLRQRWREIGSGEEEKARKY